ncbi:hypothetical protein GCM10025859_59010 [Alicyclobacillus fastidiosus]|nr:hypothetical protein GCM10025859_30170 [Alicyclobacillus fastidiosus]GMA65461.1 hypothetical protein GCM10025859_59010 [Alicyclobacillus fastidiosus]
MDTASELPVALEVTPAHVYDGEMAIPLMKEVVENYGWKVRYVMMDAGYDQVKNYEAARGYGAQAIMAHLAAQWATTWCIGEPTVTD